MTLSDDITIISTSLSDIKDAIILKGVIPSGNITTYATAISQIDSGDPQYINREISSQGVFQTPSSNFTFSLPSDAIDIGDYALYYVFYNCSFLTSVNLSSLTTVSGNSALNNAFRDCTSLTSVDLSSLTTVSGTSALGNAFQGCTSLTSVDLSSLTTVSGGNSSLGNAFRDCSSLISVDLSSLTTVSNISNSGLDSIFQGCTSLTSVDLSSLAIIGNSALFGAFGNTNLTTLSFPSLTSTSFGSYKNQFSNMLYNVTGCTVHFPSNLQSIIGGWSSVTSGFGGTNTTILFDLPATT